MWHRRVVNTLLSCALLVYSLQSAAWAAMVPATTEDPSVSRLAPAPQRLEARLEALGVAPETARMRVARLTPAERRELQRSLGQVPAGGDTLGAITFAALVLLITDLLGLTDVYPFVTRTVHDTKPGAAKAVECQPEPTASARQ